MPQQSTAVIKLPVLAYHSARRQAATPIFGNLSAGSFYHSTDPPAAWHTFQPDCHNRAFSKKFRVRQ